MKNVYGFRIFSLVFMFAVVAYCLPVNAKTPISMWIPTSPPAVAQWYKNFEAAFNAANPDIQLTIDVKADSITNMRETLVVAYAGGVAPDIHYESTNIMSRWVLNKFAAPLDKYIKQYRDWNDWIPDIKQCVEYDGSTYALPYGLTLWFHAYNMDIMANNGLVPAETWQQQISLARRLTQVDQSGNVKLYGYALPRSNILAYILLHASIEQLGLSTVVWGSTTGNINNDAGRQALQYLHDLFQAGMRNSTGGRTWADILAGRTAVFWGNGTQNSEMVNARNQGMNFLLKRYVGPEVGTSLAQQETVSLFMVSSTKHPDEAWRVMEAFAQADNLKRYYMADNWYLTVRRSLMADADVLNRPFSREQISLLTSPLTTYGPKHALYSDFRAPVGDPLLKAINDGMPVQTALEEAERILNVYLKGTASK